MQKLFKNWRRFRKEALKEQFEADALGYQAQGHTLDKLKCDVKKYPQCAELVDLGRQILSIGIPPLAIPEFKGAMQKFTDNPSLQNAGAAALALLASIPHLKGLTAAEKLSKTKQIIKTAEGTSAAMKGAPQYNQLASKIDDAVIEAGKKVIPRKAKWGEGIHFTDKAKQLEKAPDGTLISRLEIAKILDIDLNKIKKKGWDIYPPGPGSKEVWIVDGWAIHHAIHNAVKAHGYRVEDTFELIDKLKKTQKSI